MSSLAGVEPVCNRAGTCVLRYEVCGVRQFSVRTPLSPKLRRQPDEMKEATRKGRKNGCPSTAGRLGVAELGSCCSEAVRQ